MGRPISRAASHDRYLCVEIPLSVTPLKSLTEVRISFLYRSAGWAFLGNVMPMLAALAAVPILLHLMGGERLGVLTLIWVVVGYFSFLDMGLGRAVTVAVAEKREDGLALVGTASAGLAGLGFAVALLAGAAVQIWGLPLNLSTTSLQQEVTVALIWMLPSLPLLLVSSVLRGYLEGIGAFRELNLLRIPIGVMLLAGPCLTALVSPDLSWACVSILLVRVVQLMFLTSMVAREMALPRQQLFLAMWGRPDRKRLGHLASFGGWVTLSNVLGPLIVYSDRFIIGSLVAAAAVIYYSVPFDVVSRIPVLVASLGAVLIPELASLRARAGNPGQASQMGDILISRANGISLWVLSVVVVIAWTAMPQVLELWMGSDFAARSTPVARVLLLAFAVNAMSQIPFAALQAAKQVRKVALLHAAEFGPYALVLWFGVSSFGLMGAAWACLMRSLLDYAMLSWMWRRYSTRLASSMSG